MTTKYEEVGVDARKEDIEVFKSSLDNLFPQAFCTAGKDPDLDDYGVVLHTDGAGSKPVQNYLHWRESEDPGWFKSIVRDVVAMNIDDLLCIGADPISFVDYVALNKGSLPKKEVLSSLNSGFKEVLDLLEGYDIDISFLGGETADLPDQLRTLDVSGTIHGRVKISEAITGEEVEKGNRIVGLRSGGRTDYEKEENSGIMCNGITLARHSLMDGKYGEKYPEIEGSEKGYYGNYCYDDYLKRLGMTVGEAIVSPTRVFAPVLVEVLEECRSNITGMVHNTGGGQTKCLNLGKGIHYNKNEILEPDPVFELIQEESGESWRAMFEDYNMGTGFEIVVEEGCGGKVLEIAKKYGLEGKVIGMCEKSGGEKNKVTIHSEFGDFEYEEGD